MTTIGPNYELYMKLANKAKTLAIKYKKLGEYQKALNFLKISNKYFDLIKIYENLQEFLIENGCGY